MFTTDRDLLALEPNLFRDVSWQAQTLAIGAGTLVAGTLTLDAPVLAGTGIGAGHVVVVGLTPMEVLDAPADDVLIVSLIRPDPSGPQIIPADRTDAPVILGTFAPQRALTHRQLLAMLGIREGSPRTPDDVVESQIVNPRDLTLAESLGTLHLIYSAASAALPETSPQAQRARMYQERFAKERWRCRAEIDLNADGLPDATRTLNLSHLLRA
jgi:hypothetical protein